MPTIAYLVARTDFDTYKKKISANISFGDDINPIIWEAQRHELRPRLTADFFEEVMQVANTGSTYGNLTKANYDLLLPYLKPVVVYFAYARYIQVAQFHDSRYGQVIKQTPYSTPVDPQTISREAAANRSMAIDYYEELREYIEDNPSKFSTYINAQEAPLTKRTSIGIHLLSDD